MTTYETFLLLFLLITLFASSGIYFVWKWLFTKSHPTVIKVIHESQEPGYTQIIRWDDNMQRFQLRIEMGPGHGRDTEKKYVTVPLEQLEAHINIIHRVVNRESSSAWILKWLEWMKGVSVDAKR